MKIKKKLILPILTLVSLMAMGVGTTYALFTNGADTNIAIKAGKVNVSTAIDDATFKTYSGTDGLIGIPDADESLILETETKGLFSNGGTATHDGVNVTLNNITPGDRVAFNVTLKNNSNVEIKYRPFFDVVSNNGLLSGLVIKINGTVYTTDKQIANWTDAAIPTEAGEVINTLSVIIDFPTDRGNEYQEKSCTLKISVEAIQGNAYVENEGTSYPFDIYNNCWIDKSIVTTLNPCDIEGIEFVKEGSFSAPVGSTLLYQWIAPYGMNAYLYDTYNIGTQSEPEYVSNYIFYTTKMDRITLTNKCRPIYNGGSVAANQYTNLKVIRNFNIFDSHNLYSVQDMFQGCSKLREVDLSSFETPHISNMYRMFYGCSSLKELDLSSFDTSNVTNMGQMFCLCSKLTYLDISSFNTSNVTSFWQMFEWCSGLKELNLSSFDTSKVVDMKGMFSQCQGLKELDLSSFNTSNVTSMENMFYFCSGLTKLNISSFNTSKVTIMRSMFCACQGLKELDLSSFDTSNVTEWQWGNAMFSGCTNLEKLNISSFNTSSFTNMNEMFYSCSSLKELDLSSFDTSNVGDMSRMFAQCRNLEKLNISSFNTSNVGSMFQMFFGCYSLKEPDLSHFNTSKVTNMKEMFCYCQKFTELNISSFNTSNVVNMDSMFYFCLELKELDLSSFNTSNVTTMLNMFNYSKSLVTIYVSNAFVASSNISFLDCLALKGGAGSLYSVYGNNAIYARIDGGTANPGYFTVKA